MKRQLHDNSPIRQAQVDYARPARRWSGFAIKIEEVR